jgi:hypothetical protein
MGYHKPAGSYLSFFANHGLRFLATSDRPLVTVYLCGYTFGMKTAVSIPNDVFDSAERLARRTRRSRSRLFSDALREYLARHTPDNITDLMNKALAQIGAEKDDFASSAATRTLREIEW